MKYSTIWIGMSGIAVFLDMHIVYAVNAYASFNTALTAAIILRTLEHIKNS